MNFIVIQTKAHNSVFSRFYHCSLSKIREKVREITEKEWKNAKNLVFVLTSWARRQRLSRWGLLVQRDMCVMLDRLSVRYSKIRLFRIDFGQLNLFKLCGVTLIISEEDLQNFTRLACAFSPSFRRGRTFWRHDPDIELSHWLINFAPRSFYSNQQKLIKSRAQSKKNCSLSPPYRHPTIWIVVY